MRKVKQTKPSETLGGANGRTIALVSGDIATEQDLMKLMLLMFHEPEIAVEYFSLYSEPFVPPLKAAIDRGDMFLLKSENHYYKDHRENRTYVFVSPLMPETKTFPKWKRELVEKSPTFVKSTLSLSDRKKKEFAVWLEIETADLTRKAQQVAEFTYDIFLSYSNKDRAVASVIGDKLQEVKALVFMALQSGTAGAAFTEALKRSLLGSHEMWIILSPNSLKSEWVPALLGAAWVLGKKLVFLLHCCDAPQIPTKLRDLRCVDVSRVEELIKERVNPIEAR